MWHPPTPEETIRDIRTYCAQLDEASNNSTRLGSLYAEARQGYRTAHARAMLASVGKGTQRDRDARATLAVVDEQFNMELAEQKLKAARDHIASLRAQLSAAQSIGAWLRAEVNLGARTWGS